MAAAGLTRGAFYQHFRSKEDLFATAVGQDLEFTKELQKAEARTQDDQPRGAEVAIDYYLSPSNRHKIARGCTIVSNAADMARANAKARKAFTSVFLDLKNQFEGLVEKNGDDQEARALAAIATCVGGVVLARALGDEDLVERLLTGCRDAANERLTGS